MAGVALAAWAFCGGGSWRYLSSWLVIYLCLLSLLTLYLLAPVEHFKRVIYWRKRRFLLGMKMDASRKAMGTGPKRIPAV